MKMRFVFGASVLATLLVSYVAYVPSEPSFNGTNPGCGPSGGCHTFQSGMLAVTSTGNLQVRVTVNGVTGSVGDELVNSAGSVVAVNNSTSSNPFTLTAPNAGLYTVNGAAKNPSPRKWDSTQVTILLTDVNGNEPGAADFHLNQNYPNPFNPSTVIPFKLPVSGEVRLSIFDISGSEVSVLVAGWRHFGNHTVRWNAVGLAAGIYFARLDAPGFTQATKLVLVK